MSKVWVTCDSCGDVAMETGTNIDVESFKESLKNHGWQIGNGCICPLCAKVLTCSPEKKKVMELKKALVMVVQEYERALSLEYVRYPLAYALFKVWKKVDGSQRVRRKGDNG